MTELKMEHVLILVIVVFMLYHFMNRCGNGFSVGGDCDDWESEFTCLASNSAFWDDDCEYFHGRCMTEDAANVIRAGKEARDKAKLNNKNALRAAENPDGIVECPRYLASRVDSSNLANHQPTTLWGNINSDCGDSRISDICRNHQHHRAARSHPHVAGIEGCNKCYEERSDGTYACEYSGVTCERGAECFVYSYDNMCNGGIGVTIQPEDICK